MFPQVAPRFFATRAEGPKNLGKAPAGSTPPPATTASAGGSGAAPVRTPISYDVTVNGRAHRVSVTPVG